MEDYSFPDEFAPPKKKEEDEYGLRAAKAMYFAKARHGYRMYGVDTNYQALVELAQGRQSTDNIRKMFGFFDSGGKTSTDNGSLAYVDIQVLNFATKYVNKAVAKLQRYKYNISLSAVDPFSVDQAKDYSDKIKVMYQLKDWYETLKLNPQDFIPDVDLSSLPDNPDELMFNLTANQKLKKIIDGEKTLKLMNSINNVGQKLRQCDWDMVVGGRCHLHCFTDPNGIPRVEWIDPKYWGSSWVKNEDYSGAEYQFFIEFITINQFKKESNGKLSEEQIRKVLDHAFTNTQVNMAPVPNNYETYDGLKYIPVMRFYFLSNDSRSHAIWKNQYGNTMIDTRVASYRPKEKKREENLKDTCVTSVYGGTWVVDSDIVYDYGRRPIPRTNLVNARLPIISFAPNMKDGRMVSMLSQMIEPLTMINVAHNKVKDILAKGRLGVLKLNLNALENIAIGRGGNQWGPMDVVDFLQQTNILLERTVTNPYGQSLGAAMEIQNTGLTITDYFNTIQANIQYLDDLTGSTVVDSSQVPDRLAVGTMKANIAAGNESIEYLINGHVNMLEQTSHMILLLTQEAKRNKAKIKGLIPALGKGTTEFFEVPDELPYCEYGLTMEREPTEEEWMFFYQEVMNDVEKGLLNSSDSAFIRTVSNLHEARQIMANRERLNEAKAAQLRKQEQDFQVQITQQTAEQKRQLEMELLEKKKQNDMEIAILQGKIQEHLDRNKAMLEGEIAGVSAMVDERIKRQQGVDSIMKEALRSKSENYKSDKQHQSKVQSANIQSATQITTAAINAKAKEKEKSKAPKK